MPHVMESRKVYIPSTSTVSYSDTIPVIDSLIDFVSVCDVGEWTVHVKPGTLLESSPLSSTLVFHNQGPH